MPRDSFISDQLINIRDRLRENYESRNARGKEPAEESSDTAREIHLDLKNPAAPMTATSSRSPEREFNEFAGRLQHDLAAVNAELNDLGARRNAAEEFQKQLLDLSDRLQSLQVQDSQDFFRELDRLKISYFQSAGKIAGIVSDAKAEALPSLTSPASAPRRDFLLPLSILIAAAAVCTTLVLLFA